MPAEYAKVLPLVPGPLVLVVEDELTRRSIVTRMVRTLGYQARSCRGGREALRFLEAHRREVRLLLADLGMPRMDGGELAERARDLDPTLEIILMVGQGDAHLGELLSAYRDLPFLWKPISFGELAEKLEYLIGPTTPPPSQPPSLGRARARRRTSGHQEV
jgi:CheY-like chemotaxis protein